MVALTGIERVNPQSGSAQLGLRRTNYVQFVSHDQLDIIYKVLTWSPGGLHALFRRWRVSTPVACVVAKPQSPGFGLQRGAMIRATILSLRKKGARAAYLRRSEKPTAALPCRKAL
jgi:hypothetical protein